MRRFLMLIVVCVFPGAGLAQPYLSAGVGYADAEFALGAPYNGVVDDNSAVYGLDVGVGVRRFAFEIGVRGFGGFDGRATPCVPGEPCPEVITEVGGNDVTQYKASVLPRASIGEVEVFGEAGYYRAEIDTDIDLPGSDFTERGLLLGVGARWYFDEPWNFSIRASRLDDNIYHFMVGFGWGAPPEID